MNAQEAKRIPMTTLLAALGHMPVKERSGELWYLSPFRQEKTPSFKLTADQHAFYDHGLGKGGNILDFAMLYFRVMLPDALREIERHVRALPRVNSAGSDSPLLPGLFTDTDQDKSTASTAPGTTHDVVRNRADAFTDVAIKGLTDGRLLHYLKERAIPPLLARDYLQEIRYTYQDRRYFALAFANDSGGYEMRNPYYQGVFGKKAISTVRGQQSTVSASVAVFEGFFDFLSALVWDERTCAGRAVLVMNSVAMKNQTLAAIARLGVRTVHLYLDQDAAGKTLTEEFRRELVGLDVQDHSGLYAESKDFNAFLQEQHRHTKTGERLS